MKKIVFILSLAVAILSCTKENVANRDDRAEGIKNSGSEMLLFAEIPQMKKDTRAIADGSFSWADGDQIAIPISGGYAIFTYDSSKSAFTYTLTGSETFEDGTAYYPASVADGSYSTSFANADAARAGFKMEAPYTVGASSLTFSHISSLIDLNFSNVPPFATAVSVKAGSEVVATVALSNPGSNVEVKVPVTPAGSKAYSFALLAGENVLKQVSKTASLVAGTYYTTPGIEAPMYLCVKDTKIAAGSVWESSRTIWYSSTDGDIAKTFTISIGSHSYNVFELGGSVDDDGTAWTVYYKGGNSCEVAIPMTTVPGQADYYYITDGIQVASVGADPSSPAALPSTPRVYVQTNWNDLYCHMWGGDSSTTWPGTIFTETSSKYYGDPWKYVNLINNTTSFIINNGEQTADLLISDYAVDGSCYMFFYGASFYGKVTW